MSAVIDELLERLVKRPRILVVTDCAREAERIQQMLHSAFVVETFVIRDLKDVIDYVKNGPKYDLVLIDYGATIGDNVVTTLHAESPTTPIVVLASTNHGPEMKYTGSGLVSLYRCPEASAEFEPLFRSLKIRAKAKQQSVPDFSPSASPA
jgi:CheY-like chemotaxis protein